MFWTALLEHESNDERGETAFRHRFGIFMFELNFLKMLKVICFCNI